MKAVLRGGLAAALLSVTVVAVPGQAAAEPGCEWQPTTLPLPDGSSGGGVGAVDGDWFAGWHSLDGSGPFDPTPAVRWHGTTMEKLGLPFDQPVSVDGVNSSGVVVGSVLESGFHTSAVRYRDGAWERLPKQGVDSWAFDVNSGGEVLGADEGDNGPGLVVWPPSDLGTPRVLPVPDGAQRMDPRPRLDDDGTVAATYGITSGGVTTLHGFLWLPGASAPIDLPGVSDGDSVLVNDIRGGHIVGVSLGKERVGVEWDTSGQIVRKFEGDPVAVNEQGLVTGRTADDAPVVWALDDSVEPLVVPAGYDTAWTYGFGADAVGGRLSGAKNAPATWSRHC